MKYRLTQKTRISAVYISVSISRAAGAFHLCIYDVIYAHESPYCHLILILSSFVANEGIGPYLSVKCLMNLGITNVLFNFMAMKIVSRKQKT